MAESSESFTGHDIEQLVKQATRAPSSHNTQPWRFRIAENSVHVLADRTRALPVNDPDDRELCISCGCALMNLRVAASHIGHASRVERLPSADEEDLLAVVELEQSASVDNDDVDLFQYIESRQTYRKRFGAEAPPDDIIDALCSGAAREGCTLTVITDRESRRQVANLVGEGDRIQWSNPRWRRELAAWMHPRRQGDGLTVPSIAVPLARAVVRAFDLGKGVAAKDSELADGSPVLALLATPEDGVIDWLRAGEALERALLLARRHGLQASYLNQPVQLASLRPKLKELIAPDRWPQILLRLGFPTATLPASPRRPLAHVMG